VLTVTKEIWDRTLPEVQAFILGLLATVDRMQSRIQALEAEVADLKARLNSSNSHKLPSSDPAWVPKPPKPKAGRKRGGQPGHEGKFRALLPPERVDKRIDHFPGHCRFCGDDLAHSPLAAASRRHQVCEIPPVKVTVTEHRMHGRQCQRCRNATFVPAPIGVVVSCFGPNLEAFVATLIGRYRLSRREARQLVMGLTGVAVLLGTCPTS
jgi:transposase